MKKINKLNNKKAFAYHQIFGFFLIIVVLLSVFVLFQMTLNDKLTISESLYLNEREEINKEYNKTSLKVEIVEDKVEICKYHSSPNAVACIGRRGDVCVLYVPSIKYVDEEELFSAWGHELYHCAYGDFHKWSGSRLGDN